MRALSIASAILALSSTLPAYAVSSAELYTSQGYQYGRFEARLQFAAGDGVISSFFLWKDGSEVTGTFWNELDFEKLGADCHLQTNALYGSPMKTSEQSPTLGFDICNEFHTYAYEWTPEYIAWLVDGVEIRRETGAIATAFAENTAKGMQVRFNIWPGNASFGGNFDPAILPVYQYINWVQYSSYAAGAFKLEWRHDFGDAALPSGWLTGNWGSPKNLSKHSPSNVGITGGFAVLALTDDAATGIGSASASDPTDGSGGAPATGGASSTGTGTTPTTAGAGGSTASASGTGSQPVTAAPGDDGGCSMTTQKPQRSLSILGCFALVLGALAVRRRRSAA